MPRLPDRAASPAPPGGGGGDDDGGGGGCEEGDWVTEEECYYLCGGWSDGEYCYVEQD